MGNKWPFLIIAKSIFPPSKFCATAEVIRHWLADGFFGLNFPVQEVFALHTARNARSSFFYTYSHFGLIKVFML